MVIFDQYQSRRFNLAHSVDECRASVSVHRAHMIICSTSDFLGKSKLGRLLTDDEGVSEQVKNNNNIEHFRRSSWVTC